MYEWVEIHGGEFLVRGLTVGEYRQMLRAGMIKHDKGSDELLLNCFRTCVKDARDVPNGKWVDRSGSLPVERINYWSFTDPLEDLDVQIRKEVGLHVWKHLSTLSKEDSDKFRGLIRFRYWFSEDSRKDQLSSYDCETCIARGLRGLRNCGLTDEEAAFFEDFDYDAETEEEKAAREASASSAKKLIEQAERRSAHSRRQVFFSTRRASDRARDSDASRGPVSLKIYDYVFNECPISYVGPLVRHECDIALEVDKMQLPVVAGGLFDQPNRMTEIVKAVRAECSLMEYRMSKK